MVGHRVGSAPMGSSLGAIDLRAGDHLAYEEPDSASRVGGIAC